MDLKKSSKVADSLEQEKPHPMQPIADMANLSASFTGLPVKVWISSKFERHSPRMKAYLDSNTTVSISISATPQILAATDEKHTWFKAYQTGEVYNFYRRTTPTGANDFWETGTVHPKYILSDLIWLLYPTLLPADYEPYFTNKLN